MTARSSRSASTQGAAAHGHHRGRGQQRHGGEAVGRQGPRPRRVEGTDLRQPPQRARPRGVPPHGVDDEAGEVDHADCAQAELLGGARLLAQLAQEQADGGEEQDARAHAGRVPGRADHGQAGRRHGDRQPHRRDGAGQDQQQGGGGQRGQPSHARCGEQLGASGLLLASGQSDGRHHAQDREEELPHESDLDAGDPPEAGQRVAAAVEGGGDARDACGRGVLDALVQVGVEPLDADGDGHHQGDADDRDQRRAAP